MQFLVWFLRFLLQPMVLFLVYAWQVGAEPVNLWGVAAFSALPFAAGLLGLIGIHRGKWVHAFYAINILSLFAFNLLMVAYLLFVVSSL